PLPLWILFEQAPLTSQPVSVAARRDRERGHLIVLSVRSPLSTWPPCLTSLTHRSEECNSRAPQEPAAGAVISSSQSRPRRAWSRLLPHISSQGCSEAQTAGRSGLPNSLQRSASSSCTQRTPAGLPWGMPGMGLLMEGA